MEHVSLVRKLFVVLIVAMAFAAGTSLGWYARGGELPVGGMPTAAMQMAVTIDETEAEPSATTEPATESAPTSTAAPTRPQPTSMPTATPTPKEEWEVDYCPPTAENGAINCWDVVVSEDGEVARLYWIGPCLDNNVVLTKKVGDGHLYANLLEGEWSAEFVPNTCDRPDNRPSRNHLEVRTFAGPGNYALQFSPVDSNSIYVEFFTWDNAPPATAPTPTAMTKPTAAVTPTLTAGPTGTPRGTVTPEITGEWVTRVSPFNYGGICVYDIRLDGNFYWTTQETDWSLWDTVPFGDGGFFVLAFDEVTGQIRWLIGEPTDPCIQGGQLAGVVGLESYLRGIGREGLSIPPPPEVGDLD